MARSVNKIILVGNVGSDPEARAVGESRVASFSLATSEQWTGRDGTKNEATQWHRCVAWNAGKYTLADIVEKYVRKGARVYVEGSMDYRTWTDKDGQQRTTAEVKVRELVLLGGNADGGQKPAQNPARKLAPDEMPAALQDDDDDLPF